MCKTNIQGQALSQSAELLHVIVCVYPKASFLIILLSTDYGNAAVGMCHKTPDYHHRVPVMLLPSYFVSKDPSIKVALWSICKQLIKSIKCKL